MKFKIFEEGREEKEKEITLRLESSNDGVMVKICDPDGNSAYGCNLVFFRPDGRITLKEGVGDTYGFDLNMNKSIRLTNK